MTWDRTAFGCVLQQQIRTVRTVPILVGRIRKFYLHGDHNGDEIFATGGEVEILQEPESLYGDVKALPLEKLDRSPSQDELKEFIQHEELKLPAKLLLEWPDNNILTENSKVVAGSAIGPLKVDIINGKEESINKLPGERMKKLLVELRVLSHCEKGGDKTILHLTCQHGGKNWPYWFRKIENITDIGRHTLQFRTLLSDTNVSTPLKSLPALDIPFLVTEAAPDKLTVGLLETPLKVGVPFQVPLTLQDVFGNVVKPSSHDCEPSFSAPELKVKFNGTAYCGNSLIIRDVTIEGPISSTGGKECKVDITFPKLKDLSQTIEIRLFPGPPSKLEVSQRNVEIENGGTVKLNVEVKDKAGNITSHPKLNIVCKVSGIPGFQSMTCDCSSTGKGILVSQPVNLKDVKNGKVITARLSLQHYKDVKTIEQAILVKPSSRASKIQVFYTPPGANKKQAIENGQDVYCVAGKLLTGVYFVIFDEGNRQLDIDQSLASKIKVNWAGKINKEELKEGKLPDIKAPSSIDDVKYCQVTCTDGSGAAEHVFSLKATHAAPSSLKPLCANTEFRMSEPLTAEITVTLHDNYGNAIKFEADDLAYLSVSGDGLKEQLVKMNVYKKSFILKNIHFENGVPGPRVICIQWKDIVCYQKLEMLPGPATDLILIDFDNKEPLEIRNGSKFPKSIRIQLVDVVGNKTKEKNVRCLIQRDPNLKLVPPPAQQRTDVNGQAVFDNFTTYAPRGVYQIIPRAILASGNKDGPLIIVNVEPDPNKAMGLAVAFGEQRVFSAGHTLPEIDVYVVSENETPLTTIKSKELAMKLWNVQVNKSSTNVHTYTASVGRKSDPKHHFYFRGIKLPKIPGEYCFVIEYITKNPVKLSSKQIDIMVCPGRPVKLVPVTIPATPTASNDHKYASRLLVKNLKFELKDRFGNTAGLDSTGVLIVSVKSSGKGARPCLQGDPEELSFVIAKGSSTVPHLMLEADTKGVDGQEYVLLFEALLSASKSPPIEPFRLPFFFYDDLQKQSKMTELTKERDKLTGKINAYRALFDTRAQLLKETQGAFRDASLNHQNIKNELLATGYRDANRLTTKDDISIAIESLRKSKHRIEVQPLRKCRLPVGRKDNDVIGKVAHLALIHEDDVARVLSWHLASDMDCVVTTTTEQAKKVHSQSNGRQQVLPLDSIYKKGLPDWKKPLPHIRFPAIKTVGNVQYARDFLVIPEHEEKCKMIFGMLLGNTIIADNLDIATKYRQEVVKYTYCPTLLTRTGERIGSYGKFGGLQNKAPQLDKMNGAVFSCPLPPMHETICNQIDLLSNLEAALSKVYEDKSELEVQLDECNSKTLEDSYVDCVKAENQLHEIEAQLGLTSRLKSLPPSLKQYFAIHISNKNITVNGGKRTAPSDSNQMEHTSAKRARSNHEQQIYSTKSPMSESNSKDGSRKRKK